MPPPQSTANATTAPTAPNIITALTVQKRNNSRCSVFLDGEFAFGCTIDTVERFALRKGMTLTDDLRRDLEAHDGLIRVKQAAYVFVSFKPRTRKQVRQKMLDKGFTPEEADYAVEFLEEFRHLDDKNYARMFIADTLARKAVGLDKLRMELKKRGVSDHDIADTLAENFDRDTLAEQTAQNALQAARKKYPAIQRKESDPYKRKHALSAHLQRNGFAYNDIKHAIAEVMAED
jgi:regulatory protein